jgi:hypothetical protein
MYNDYYLLSVKLGVFSVLLCSNYDTIPAIVPSSTIVFVKLYV